MAECGDCCSEYSLESKSSPWETKMQAASWQTYSQVERAQLSSGRESAAWREKNEKLPGRCRCVHMSCIKTLIFPVSVGGSRTTPREMPNYASII